MKEQTSKRRESHVQPKLPEKDTEIFLTAGVFLFVPDADVAVRPQTGIDILWLCQ